MATGIGVFGPERGTEGINISKGRGKELGLQLAANGQTGFGAEEIIVPGDAAVSHGWVFRVECRHTEHFAGAFTIVGGDDRRMHMHKTPLLEKAVHGMTDTAANTKNRTVGVGPGPQMSNCAQELEAMALFLQREALVNIAVDNDLLPLNFPALARTGRGDHLASHTDAGAGA